MRVGLLTPMRGARLSPGVTRMARTDKITARKQAAGCLHSGQGTGRTPRRSYVFTAPPSRFTPVPARCACGRHRRPGGPAYAATGVNPIAAASSRMRETASAAWGSPSMR